MGIGLNLIRTGVVASPDLMLIYGPMGVGKTSFGSKAPKPVFVGTETGFGKLSVDRLPTPRTLSDVFKCFTDIRDKDHDRETIVFDSVDWLEPLIWEETCRAEGVANIEQVGGGFGKGAIIAMKYWHQFKSLLTEIQEKKQMNIILLGHSEVKYFNDPTTNSTYDRYQLKLDKRASALLREWVDFVGFADYKTFTKGKENAARHKAYGDGTRVLYTERRPAFDAKNRLGLPFELPLDFGEYERYARADVGSKVTQVKENIEEMLSATHTDEFKNVVRETVLKAKENLTDLLLVQERLRAKIQKETEVYVRPAT